MNEVFRLVATIRTNGAAAIKEFKAAEGAGKTAGARLGSAFKTLGKIMKVVFVVGAAAATYAMGKFFVSSIKSAAAYEKQMANVKAVTGATGKEFEALNKKAKQLGKDTKFTMISISEGMEALGRAGMTANEIIDSMAGVTDLAASQNIRLGEAAEMTAGALNGFNLAADQAGRVADVYAYAASNSAIRTEDLAETLKYAMPAANALGYSLEDVAGMAMILGDNMIKGSMAGTGLSFAFSELVGMSDEFKKKLGDVGVSVADLTGPDGKLMSMAEILGVLKTKGLDAGDMFELFGKRAGKSMAILLDKGETAIKDYTGALEECGGTAEEMAEIQLNTLSGQLEILKGSWELLKVTVGEKLMPILKDFLKETIIPLVNKMVDWAKESDTLKEKFKAFFDKLKDGIEWIVEHRESLVKAIKAITVGFAALVAIKAATWIAGVVTGLTGPAGLVVALALAGVALGRFLKERVTTFEEAAKLAAEEAEELSDAIANLTPNATAAFVAIQDLAEETGRMNEELERSEAAQKMGGTVLQMGRKVSTAYLEMKVAIDEWRASQEASADEGKNWVLFMAKITGEGKTLWRSFVDTLKALTTGLREDTLEEWKGIYEGIKGFLNGIFTNTCDMFEKNRKAREDYEKRVAEIREGGFENEKELLDEAEKAYEEERVTVWGILWQGVKDFIKAIREKFVAIAAEQTALGIIAALVGNIAGAIAHGAAALKAGAVAVGLAVAGFQEGGIVTRPTVAILGEYGPEAVVPLPRISGGFGQGQLAYAGAGGGGIAGSQVVIEEMHVAEGATFYVREEADIERIAKELGDEFDDRIIGKGRVTP